MPATGDRFSFAARLKAVLWVVLRATGIFAAGVWTNRRVSWYSPVSLVFAAGSSDNPEKNGRLLRYEGLHYVRNPETGHGTIVDLTFHW
jgi:hypothetical protein